MRALVLSLSLAALCGACSSKVASTVDTALQNKADTVTDCLPPVLQQFNALLDYADLWRLNGGNNPADPAGLVWAEQGDGSVNVTITLTGFTITSTIRFYSPGGAAQDLNLSLTSLSQAIDDAATQLRALFTTGTPFMVGTWSLAGTGISGSGALTGLIAGSTNQNELEEVRTTTAVVSGGPPPVADGTINGGTNCTLVFNTSGLRTDDTPGQEYPAGVVTVTLTGPKDTVNATLTFDGTVVAKLAVTGITGTFHVNLQTRSVHHVP